MLYEHWRRVVSEHRSALALVDLQRNERWTFAQLADQEERSSTSNVCYPSGPGPAFIFSVLHGWRQRKIICPLEPGQAPPACGNLPPGIVHVKTTSATTGAVRMILFDAAALTADAANIVATMGLRADWPNLGVISLAHSYGFSNLVLPLLLHGIPLMLLPSPMPEAVRGAVAQIPDLTMPAVPALWRIWCDAGVITARFRLAISAGAPLSLALEKQIFQETGVKLHNFYGASECGGIAYDRSGTPRDNPALLGTCLENVRLAATPEGCLEVHSDAVAREDWPTADGRLGQGVYRTDDLAELKGDQVLLRGRASDQINVAGRKLAPETVEQALQQCGGVQDCVVFGVESDGAGRGEDIVACVVAERQTDRRALERCLQQSLPAWQMPRRWWFVKKLQTNQRGKISRAEWRRLFLERGRSG